MTLRKSSKKVRNRQNLIKTIVGLVVLLILIIILIVILFYNQKEFYKIEPRAENINKVELSGKTDYKAIGWLRVQGTKMDLPIIQSAGQSEVFPSELKSFVWSLNSDSKFHNHIFVMGHNILNLSSTPKITSKTFTRAEELMAFVYYDFAKKNKYIQLTIDNKEYLYKIFSVGFVQSYKSLLYVDLGDLSKDRMTGYLDMLNQSNIYDYDIDVNENDDIITVATCTRFFGPNSNYEFFVNGRLVRENEKISNYSVKKSKKYNEIEKKLKGDGGNEDDNL